MEAAPVWLGTADAGVRLLRGEDVEPVAEVAAPSFVAEHPTAARLYALAERDPGLVQTLRTHSGEPVGPAVASGGAGPCHLLVHPAGGWLYVAHYGDGTLSALALDEHGDPTGEVVRHPHAGTGPDPARQEGPHAHSATLAPGGRHLVVADLGTDELRAYLLRDGRPEGPMVSTRLPAGCGPRHVAVVGDLLHVSGELSDDVVTVRWDRAAGHGEVVGVTSAVTVAPRTGDQHALSHVEAADGYLLVGVRGADTVAVMRLDESGLPTLVDEVPTAAWPRHLTVHGETVLVAGERADVVAVHPWRPASATPLGEPVVSVQVPSPMCVLPARHDVPGGV